MATNVTPEAEADLYSLLERIHSKNNPRYELEEMLRGVKRGHYPSTQAVILLSAEDRRGFQLRTKLAELGLLDAVLALLSRCNTPIFDVIEQLTNTIHSGHREHKIKSPKAWLLILVNLSAKGSLVPSFDQVSTTTIIARGILPITTALTSPREVFFESHREWLSAIPYYLLLLKNISRYRPNIETLRGDNELITFAAKSMFWSICRQDIVTEYTELSVRDIYVDPLLNIREGASGFIQEYVSVVSDINLLSAICEAVVGFGKNGSPAVSFIKHLLDLAVYSSRKGEFKVVDRLLYIVVRMDKALRVCNKRGLGRFAVNKMVAVARLTGPASPEMKYGLDKLVFEYKKSIILVKLLSPCFQGDYTDAIECGLLQAVLYMMDSVRDVAGDTDLSFQETAILQNVAKIMKPITNNDIPVAATITKNEAQIQNDISNALRQTASERVYKLSRSLHALVAVCRAECTRVQALVDKLLFERTPPETQMNEERCRWCYTTTLLRSCSNCLSDDTLYCSEECQVKDQNIGLHQKHICAFKLQLNFGSACKAELELIDGYGSWRLVNLDRSSSLADLPICNSHKAEQLKRSNTM